MVRYDGDSMNGIGIYAGNILVVDRSLKPKHGDTVVATVDGAFTVKTLSLSPEYGYCPKIDSMPRLSLKKVQTYNSLA